MKIHKDMTGKNADMFNSIDLDVDEVDEIDDRLEELEKVVGDLETQTSNAEMLKIILTAYTIERSKILSLIYKFKQVRCIREDEVILSHIESCEEVTENIH